MTKEKFEEVVAEAEEVTNVAGPTEALVLEEGAAAEVLEKPYNEGVSDTDQDERDITEEETTQHGADDENDGSQLPSTCEPVEFDAKPSVLEVSDPGKASEQLFSCEMSTEGTEVGDQPDEDVPGPVQRLFSHGPYDFFLEGDRLVCWKQTSTVAVETEIGPPLTPVCRARNASGSNHSRVFEFTDEEGQKKKITVLNADIHDRPGAVIRKLANAGYDLRAAKSEQDVLQKYLVWAPVSKTAHLLEENGWIEINGQWFYLNGEEVVSTSSTPVVISHEIENSTFHSKKGSFEAWKSEVAARCQGNLTLMFMINLALAGPLCTPLNAEALGVNLVGLSGQGKTTSLLTGASVYGNPRKGGFVRSMRSTEAGFAKMMRLLSDSAQFCDELGEVQSNMLGRLIYMSNEGTEKTRLETSRNLEDPGPARVITVTTGEISTDVILKQRNMEMQAGQVVRLGNVDISDLCDGDVFADLHGAEDVEEFLQDLAEARNRHFGHAGPEFVRFLLSDFENCRTKAKDIMNRFRQSQCEEGDPSPVTRYAKFLGVVKAAGCLAYDAGIVPWTYEETHELMAAAFDAWKSGIERSDIDPREAAYRHVQGQIERYGMQKFAPWKDEMGSWERHDIWGYRRVINGKTEYLVLPGVFNSPIFLKGCNRNQLCKILKEKGVLRTTDGNQFQAKRPLKFNAEHQPKQQKFINITEDILELTDQPKEKPAVKGPIDGGKVDHGGVFDERPRQDVVKDLREQQKRRRDGRAKHKPESGTPEIQQTDDGPIGAMEEVPEPESA